MSPGVKFSLERSGSEPKPTKPGDCVAYYTTVGGGPRGRWVRALSLYRYSGFLVALDEENDLVYLRSWELCRHRPPVLKPKVLQSWLRALAYYVTPRASAEADEAGGAP